jgi:hypothetical protein
LECVASVSGCGVGVWSECGVWSLEFVWKFVWKFVWSLFGFGVWSLSLEFVWIWSLEFEFGVGVSTFGLQRA